MTKEKVEDLEDVFCVLSVLEISFRELFLKTSSIYFKIFSRIL